MSLALNPFGGFVQIHLCHQLSGVDSSTQHGECEMRLTRPGFLTAPIHRRRAPSSTVARPPDYDIV